MSNPTCNKAMQQLAYDRDMSSGMFNEQFQTEMSRFSSLVNKFKCNCPKPCAVKQFVLLNIQSNPAKQDLRDLASIGRSDSAEDLCRNPEILGSQKISNQAKIRILLLRKESTRSQSVFYNAAMALADGYNAIGLFFGITFLSVYDALEACPMSSKKSTPSSTSPKEPGASAKEPLSAKEPANDKEPGYAVQLRERLHINKLLLLIANFRLAASVDKKNRVFEGNQTHLNQRSPGSCLPSLWFLGWLCCMSALLFQVRLTKIFSHLVTLVL